MKERRKFARLKAPIGISYSLVKKHKRPRRHLTFIHNISGAGVSLIAKDDLRVGDLVKLEIQIPHLEETVGAVGEVIWFSFSRGKEHSAREAGIRFRDISAPDLNQVLEYVYTIGIG